MHNDLEPIWLIFLLPMLQALALAMAYQSVTDHHKQRPPINNLGPNDSIPNPPTVTSAPRLLRFWCHSNATFDVVVVTCDNSFTVDDMVDQVFFSFFLMGNIKFILRLNIDIFITIYQGHWIIQWKRGRCPEFPMTVCF